MSSDQASFKTIWREIFSLFLPIIIILFAGSAIGMLERVWLARYSLDALKGAVQAICALQFFQVSCLSFANLTQVFLGQHLGLNEPAKVGPSTWQMIWLSILSMLLALPLSFVVEPIFFTGTEGREVANSYFKVLIGGNFLFPLGATLSAFFLAQGKRWVVVQSALIAYGVNLVFDLLLIFGIPSLLDPLGAVGAAWSGLIAKSVFCAILFMHFINRFNREHYWTDRWKLDFSSLWHHARVCAPRAVGKIFALIIWTATTYLMIAKGGDYLSILSIGTSLTLFCAFLSDSLIQTLSVIISRYLGSKDYCMLWKSWRLGILFALIVCGSLAIPCLIFPKFILSFFFSELPNGMAFHHYQFTVYWVWLWVLFNSLNSALLAFLLAARDTFFYMVVMSLTWLTSCLPIYLGLYHLKWSPDKFWLVLVVDQLVVVCLYAWRVYSVGQSFKQDLPQKSLEQTVKVNVG